MIPFVTYLAPDLDFVQVIDERALPLGDAPSPWLLTEVDRTAASGRNFHRDRARLWNIVRHRYFDAAIEPFAMRPGFRSGWEPSRTIGHEEWRCMTGASATTLPGSSDRMRLRLMLTSPATVEVRLNGVVLDRFAAPDIADRQYDVTPAAGAATNVLELSAAPGTRVCLRNLSWGRV
jgi:hypothetical protein